MPVDFIQQARSVAIKLGAIMMSVRTQRLDATFSETKSNECFLDFVDGLPLGK